MLATSHALHVSNKSYIALFSDEIRWVTAMSVRSRKKIGTNILYYHNTMSMQNVSGLDNCEICTQAGKTPG